MIGACSTYEGEERMVMDFGGKAKEKRTHGRPRCRWKNTLKCTFKNWDCRTRNRLIWLRTSGRLMKNYDEPAGSVKYTEFFDQLRNC
jgi:hypothetical protein